MIFSRFPLSLRRPFPFQLSASRMMPPPSSNAPVLSPAQTLVDGRVPQRYSVGKRYTLLVIFCLAQFLDAMNNCALFSAIPSLVIDLGMTSNESTWIIAGFQLTFASFLLIVSNMAVLLYMCGIEIFFRVVEFLMYIIRVRKLHLDPGSKC